MSEIYATILDPAMYLWILTLVTLYRSLLTNQSNLGSIRGMNIKNKLQATVENEACVFCKNSQSLSEVKLHQTEVMLSFVEWNQLAVADIFE